MSSVKNMELALNAITAGSYSTSQAAVEFNVPETTLRSIKPKAVCFYFARVLLCDLTLRCSQFVT